ncbi:hypothetical protein [Armatimonas sp.]|uniref:hypothetical protein n=1 Tax=Armatimonas sp. TaxID=1872638 RepID=UPI0037520BAA
MKARLDDKTITLTPRYIAALYELGRAKLEMMRQEDPDNADCWDWCIITVHDLVVGNQLSLECGGNGDRVAELPGGEVLVRSDVDVPDYEPSELIV